MNLRFLPKGGFNKNGAFVEYWDDEPTGGEPEYDRSRCLSGDISLDIACDQVEVRTIAEIVNEYDEVKDSDRTITKIIVGEGAIQPAGWGSFTLSFFGDPREHDKVSVVIRSSEIGEAVYFAGTCDEFYVEISVHSSRFDALVSELAESGAILKVHVKISKFPNFYATWSPTYSEERVIKYLEEKRDVENADDIPEDFWIEPSEQKKMLSDKDIPPAHVAVVRTLKSPL